MGGPGTTVLREAGPQSRLAFHLADEPMLKKVRQLIESVNDTFKGQLDLEQHAGRTFEGIAARVAQRVLALTASVWFNFQAGNDISRSLIAFDH